MSKNYEDTHYTNAEGMRVATAQHHRNRGTCCKSGCLHCPYGTTIERYGLKFYALEGEKLKNAMDMVNNSTQGVAAALLQQAFGKKSHFPTITEENARQFRIFDLKGYYAGLAHVENDQVKRIHLLPYFEDQGLTVDVVNRHFTQSQA